MERAEPFAGMPATSSSLALAHAFTLLRQGRASSALVASKGTTASIAIILTSTEAIHDN
jgi:hypothetical protein